MNIPNPVNPALSTVQDILSLATRLLFPGIGLLLLLVLIIGGIWRMTAAGDPEKEKTSMKILTNGMIGVVIIVLARLIIQTIGSLLGITLL